MFVCCTGRSQSMQSLNRNGGGGDAFRLRRGQGRVFRGNNSQRRPFRRGGREYFISLVRVVSKIVVGRALTTA